MLVRGETRGAYRILDSSSTNEMQENASEGPSSCWNHCNYDVDIKCCTAASCKISSFPHSGKLVIASPLCDAKILECL